MLLLICGTVGPQSIQAASTTVSVTDVRFWSLGDVTRVAVETSGEFTYKFNNLSNPPRIYFDISPARQRLSKDNIHAIEVGDGLVKQIRVSQNQKLATRVVLDLNADVEVTASQLANPDRLMIEVRKKSEKPDLSHKRKLSPPKQLAAKRTKSAPPQTTEPAKPSTSSPAKSTPPSRSTEDEPKVVARNVPPAPVPTAKQEPAGKAPAPEPPSAQKPPVSSKDEKSTQVATPKPAPQTAPAEQVAKQDPPASKPTTEPKQTAAAAAPPPAPPATPPPTESPEQSPAQSRAQSPAPAPETQIAEKRPVTANPTARQAKSAKASPTSVAAAVKPKPPEPVEEPEDEVEALIGLPGKQNQGGGHSLTRVLGLKLGRVVIDPGHGGRDPGTIGPTGLREKDVTLDVSKRLAKLIEERLGSEVVLTRTSDKAVDLEERTQMANDKRADLFVSVHVNWSRYRTVNGVETFYLNFTRSRADLEVAARENAGSNRSIHELSTLVQKIALDDKVQESRDLAANVQTAVHGSAAKHNAKVRDRGVKKAPLVVLIGAQMPSVLVEIGFISNPQDEKLMKRNDFRQNMAEGIYAGVAKYAESLSHFQVARRTDDDE